MLTFRLHPHRYRYLAYLCLPTSLKILFPFVLLLVKILLSLNLTCVVFQSRTPVPGWCSTDVIAPTTSPHSPHPPPPTHLRSPSPPVWTFGTLAWDIPMTPLFVIFFGVFLSLVIRPMATLVMRVV